MSHASRPAESSPTLLALRRLISAAELVQPAVAQQAGLTRSEVRTLELLSRGPLGPAEIARRLDVSTAASSGIVDRLVGHGHAVRTPHPSDRRRQVVEITESGRSDTLALLAPMLDRLDRLDAELDEHEREMVARYLEGCVEALLSVVPAAHRPAHRPSQSPLES
jgi:DNA-binding MarR family transcriptional regulator